MDVLVPNWPFFHPSDLPSLAKEILMVDDLYWRYDEGGSCWIKTNRQLRVDTGLTLYTRGIGVTSCPNLPGSTPMNTPSTPTKRRATPDSAFDGSPSPAKLFRTTSSPSVGDSIFRCVHFTLLTRGDRSDLLCVVVLTETVLRPQAPMPV